MRSLIHYIRSCFCKHEFFYDEHRIIEEILWEQKTIGVKVSATCKKCGYHKSYWKY